MYFSNVSNEELQYFHQKLGTDFSMSLTDILASELFHTETIILNELYRVYPLFYCKEISSSNSDDVILENRCIIINKQTDETYLTFRTDATENVVVDDTLLSLFDVSDTLTTNQYNDLIFRLRKQIFTGILNFKEETIVSGLYGTYVLNNIAQQLRSSQGIVINDKLKANPITVKLINPFFLDANYVLTFTVYTSTSLTTFSIDLVEDVPVSIPVSSYTNDDILSFDVWVTVDFNTPEIRPGLFTFDATVDEDTIIYGDSTTLTATLSNSGEVGLSGYVVQIYEDGSLIDTSTTDEYGEVTKTISPSTVGLHTYSAKCLGLTKDIPLNVEPYPTVLTSTISNARVSYGTSVTATAKLTSEETPLADEDIEVYVDNTLITTLQTDDEGEVSYTASNLSMGNHNVLFKYVQTTVYAEASSSKSVTVLELGTTLSVTSSGNTSYGNTMTFTGLLKSGNSNLNGKTIDIYLDGNYVKSETTNNGSVSYSVANLNAGNHTVKMIFNGDSTYTESTDSTTVTITKISSSISISVNPTTFSVGNVGWGPRVEGDLSAGNQPITIIMDGRGVVGTVAGPPGHYTGHYGDTISYTLFSKAGTYSVYVAYYGDENHYGCTSETVTITVTE